MAFAERLVDFAERREHLALLLGVVVAVGLRCALAVFPYSGEGTPPMYGDFEAQRHWMEITTALPLRGWYENTTDNDLMYWGLDYPPLTAYHSYIVGAVGHRVVPECFRLATSRGHESPPCRAFMRSSAIVSDLVVYLPGAAYAARAFSPRGAGTAERVLATVALWLLPPLALIDHGHFQFNGVCFGLCLAGAGCVARGRTLLASVLFTSGLLYKQIALYYAPAFFFGILAACVHRSEGVVGALGRVAVTGAVVLGTVAAVFAPWLAVPSPGAAAAQVLHRMFPFARGLYEDKVANVWCTISVAVKLHRLLPAKLIPVACAGATLTALLPACACCLRSGECGGGRTGAAPFAAALTASSFAFFLFAFQVHEKSVLFPCVAACLLPVALGPARRPLGAVAGAVHLCLACLYSMYPLVVKDGLHVPYCGLCVALVLLCEAAPASGFARAAHRLCYAGGLAVHAVHALAPPPARYPDAWTLLVTGSSCAYFVLCLAAVTAAQIAGYFAEPLAARGKKTS